MARRILVLSLSVVPADGRILRQIGSLRRAGRSVEAIGLSCTLETDLPYRAIASVGWGGGRRLIAALGFLSARLLPGERATLALASAYPGIAGLRAAALEWAEGQANLDDVAVIAHDWTSLPAAIALHDRFGLPFHYDSHEFAAEEHAHSAAWRLIFPGLIRRIEAAGIARAASVSCPGPGIRDAMNAAYRPVARAVEIIRNVPDAMPLPPTPTGRSVELLYHGLFKPDRGLLDLVASAAHWPDNFRLLLRGAAPNPTFATAMTAAVAAAGARVRIEPMVPANMVSRAAQASDIGVFLPDIASPQNRFAMPNKLYEYLHAGLMVVVPSSTDMAVMVEASGAGLVVDDVATLAAKLATLTPATIDVYRAAAHALAHRMCWAAEERHFLELLGIVLPRNGENVSDAISL